MNITRVERDGVEFFTIEETGESGMSESGLSRLCGVSQQGVNKLLRTRSTTSHENNGFKLRPGAKLWLLPKSSTAVSNSNISNIKIVSAEACAAVIEYYAFDSKYKTKAAAFAVRKFSSIGITAWIQEITHWSGNPIPKSGIVVDFKTIEQLMDKKLDATTYRVYLILQKAIRLRMTLTPEEIMQRADVGRSAYMNAIGKLQDAKLLPDWCKVQRRMHPERDVRDRLQTQLGGKVEAYTKWGLIDLLTETELIEVKIVHQWKDAIGHLIAKSRAFPNHSKRLHLFGPEDPRLDHIEEICTECHIRITFEKVAKPIAQNAVVAIDRES